MDTAISFEDITFTRKDGQTVTARFYKNYYFEVGHEELQKIGDFTLSRGRIIFEGVNEDKAWHKIGNVLKRGFSDLRTNNGKRAIYIHRQSGIPLIGSGSFGIIDRGTNLIEVKPITGCNLKCVYCSVDDDKRAIDIVVEKDYLVEQLDYVIGKKGGKDIEIHIGVQGEPLMYSPLASLIRDIKKDTRVARITMDTNATMLTKGRVDELIDAGLTVFNVSLNAIDPGVARKIAGCDYQVDRVLDIARHIAAKGDHLLIAPVLIPGMNEEEMDRIIRFAQSLPGKVRVGIQNFLNYRQGRNPAKQMSFDTFYSFLKERENETGERLILRPDDFGIKKMSGLEKPFRKDERVKAEIMIPGRIAGEMIAVAKDRCITVTTDKKKGMIDLIITRTKHNIFYAKAK